jgi:transcriptional regulator with XRE-family HTH domain
VNKHPSLVKLGQRIRKFRDKAEISQEELAHRADLDRTYVGGVERGERNLGVLNLLTLADALGISASVLLTGISTRKGE